MAERTDLTPKKTASEHEFEICRCCAKNISKKSYDKIFLFGIKSDTDNIIDLVKRFGGIDVFDGDGLPKYICRTCWLKVKNLCTKTDDFKLLCKESEEKFKQQERFKRCRKDEKIDAATSQTTTLMPLQLSKKARNARTSLDEHFTQSKLVKIAPKPSKESSTTNSPMPMNNSPSSISSRVLPPMFKNSTTKKNDDGFRILSCSGLANNKVFWHIRPLLHYNYEHFKH